MTMTNEKPATNAQAISFFESGRIRVTKNIRKAHVRNSEKTKAILEQVEFGNEEWAELR